MIEFCAFRFAAFASDLSPRIFWKVFGENILLLGGVWRQPMDDVTLSRIFCGAPNSTLYSNLRKVNPDTQRPNVIYARDAPWTGRGGGSDGGTAPAQSRSDGLLFNPPPPGGGGGGRIRPPPLGFSGITSSFFTVSTWNLAHLSGHQFGVVSCKENQNRPEIFCYRSIFVTSLHAILGR